MPNPLIAFERAIVISICIQRVASCQYSARNVPLNLLLMWAYLRAKADHLPKSPSQAKWLRIDGGLSGCGLGAWRFVKRFDNDTLVAHLENCEVLRTARRAKDHAIAFSRLH